MLNEGTCAVDEEFQLKQHTFQNRLWTRSFKSDSQHDAVFCLLSLEVLPGYFPINLILQNLR